MVEYGAVMDGSVTVQSRQHGASGMVVFTTCRRAFCFCSFNVGLMYARLAKVFAPEVSRSRTVVCFEVNCRTALALPKLVIPDCPLDEFVLSGCVANWGNYFSETSSS